jgi:ubiquinone/menaquinone biosynthesis C-methylase UbiE
MMHKDMHMDSDADSRRVKDVVRRHWSARAADFDNGPTHGLLSDPQRSAWSQRLQAWSGTRAMDALDVGCGTGFFALQLAASGHRATGVDLAAEMLELARAKAAAAGLSVRFDGGDAEHLPYATASFDLVIERHVIWTLPAPEVALREWARVLRPGGRVVLIEGDWRRGSINPDYAGIVDALPLYGGRPASELSERVAATGFKSVTIEPLADEALWGGPQKHERYAVLGTAHYFRESNN